MFRPKKKIDATKNNDKDISLESELKKLEKSRDARMDIRRSGLIIFFIAEVIIIVFSIFLFSNNGERDNAESIWTMVGLGIYSVLFLLIGFLFPINNLELRINQLKDEIDLRTVGEKSDAVRAEKQFKLHQNELKRYYDQSLKHGSWIFYVGIANLFAGLIIIGVTIYLVSSSDEKLIVGAVGGISGVLTNFIAVIFLRMYSGTIKSLSDFHNRLVFSNHLQYSNLLVSKIFDEKLRSETWAKLALTIVEKEKVTNEEKKYETKGV